MTKREPNARGEGVALRAQLVAAAGDLLMSPQQVALPSLRAVARACSVSPAAVYLHFESQQHLIQAVLDAQVEQLRAHLESAVPVDADARGQVVAFAQAYASWGLAHPGAYQLLFESADRLDVPDHDDDPGMALIARAGQLISVALGTDDAAGQRLSFQFWAVLHGIVSLRLHKPQLERPTSVETDVDDAVAMLMTRALHGDKSAPA
jgi:AcrR family transcriptional regulator